MHRRRFLSTTAAASAGFWLGASHKPAAGRLANDRISVCVVGVRGRGGALLNTFASLEDVDIKYVCDVDADVLGSRIEQVESRTNHRPQGITEYEKALEDKTVDALVLGTPDHWHALPTIHACQAGKDVYVEKPDGHNILEGRTMVAAAQRHQRVVQLGTQARSGAMQHQAMKYLATGALGKVRLAKAWESTRQGSIGKPPDSDPPEGVDYDRWLGPAPLRPFNTRRFHGSWRWFFDYGTGDLGNEGVHRLDLARWAMETAAAAQGEQVPPVPQAVSAMGGKFYFDDAQQWPDTMMVSYQYPKLVLTYEMRVWTRYPLHGESEGAVVYGDNGWVVIGNRRWRAYDAEGKEIEQHEGSDASTLHARNFIDCMRSRQRPAADLETVGHPSSLLCHLGNAAWRTGSMLKFDVGTYSFVDSPAGNALLTRPEYRKPYVLPSIT